MPFVTALLLTAALAACSSGGVSKSKAEKAINDGLAKSADCMQAPVDVPYVKDRGDGLPLKALQAQGLVAPGKITQIDVFGKAKEHEGFVFTPAAAALIAKPAELRWPGRAPCVRSGKFQVTQVEAIEVAADGAGRPIATVRVRIKFMPETWLAATRADSQWSSYWGGIEQTEKTQWVYGLLKSGDELFYAGKGQRLQ